ncbi:hypothetical protein NLC82_04390 [Candidatus Aminicenantes bacterium AC-335-A11]|jgi:hypothetical protein|nr:hypothetical protein [SCandidatus Aminicenantes bacterium Aminicenantia_JdfR_composite]MCP2596875.1 hypothetical protein [Candidatus Aminicenantes bacterium AC-335-G13]MCP2598494.1 hypothetical protein [Candidatus Aminicenantes bacterium AC-335-L06]MCP2605830.1 hypothetical protein [Candidatus Aminicenantes bacterium AC-335-O07]MCP2606218.1 hypothetical protein [Candidatus Aminicenantes bacterium AC-708-I09]MCP2618641.1 hypothetical protein [Candidatus Aminicenantes bacterium AC-335-A11]
MNRNIFDELEKVRAPRDFEIKLMGKLTFYKRKRERRLRILRVCVATATILILIYIGFNFIDFRANNKNLFTTKIQQEENVLPVTEIIEYPGELSEVSNGKKTIYILEQVSDREGAYF